MFYYSFQVVFKEVPKHISLCFSICGCPLRCKGCHSPFLFKNENGKKLYKPDYVKKLKSYQNLATCVLFMGGEWEQEALIDFLRIAKQHHYKTCLYTGLNHVDLSISQYLDYLKTGSWQASLGGLESRQTNQRFTELATGKILNSYFQKNT
ncbi:anaerobic ribonucleoside-triphosphate reductase activating protein [Ochrovirga pacifica]|uniref:anaerobic ribonucleoside-triphosphate reductase activating protein n=1 Tax=Ochrovirga pacifica TaxID=1042376 RepID=UPI000496E6B0|nr:anaerobic ribonucleoside-triphosphate reductase activating protein [Ochrovirga pacifica]